MKYFQKVRAFLLLFTMLGLVSHSLQTKKVNCRKYVYAPACRGVAAKRVLPSGKSFSIREPRGEPMVLDPDTPVQWKDKDKGISEKGMLRIMFKKLAPKVVDYDNGNLENYLN